MIFGTSCTAAEFTTQEALVMCPGLHRGHEWGQDTTQLDGGCRRLLFRLYSLQSSSYANSSQQPLHDTRSNHVSLYVILATRDSVIINSLQRLILYMEKLAVFKVYKARRGAGGFGDVRVCDPWSPAAFLNQRSVTVLYTPARSQLRTSPDSQIKHGVCHTDLHRSASRGALMKAIKNKCKWLPWGSLSCRVCRSAPGCQDGSLPWLRGCQVLGKINTSQHGANAGSNKAITIMPLSRTRQRQKRRRSRFWLTMLDGRWGESICQSE